MITSSQETFLKSCFRLPGFAEGSGLSGKNFLDREAFVLFILKQTEHLSFLGNKLSVNKYLQPGKWGFCASVTINGQKEILTLALDEKDSFRSALRKLITALNVLIIQSQLTRIPQKQGFLKKLSTLFTYQPGPLSLHMISSGNDLYIGYLPETVSTEIKLGSIRRRQLIRQKPFPFPAFSCQPEKSRPEALVVNAMESANPKLLSDFTGLNISNKNGWHLADKEGRNRMNLNCRGHYADVIFHLNKLTANSGASLYIQPYPWNKDLLFFISNEQKESYDNFLLRPGDEEKYIANDKHLALELTEAYTLINPNDIPALGELTGRYGQAGNHKKVLALTQEYLLIAPDNYTLQNNQLIAYVHLQNYREAIKSGLLALRLKPGSARTKYFMGTAYTHLGELDKALEFLEFSVADSPEEPFHWFALAFAYYRMGDYDKAIEKYKISIDTSESYNTKEDARASSWYNIACICSLQNRIDESKTAYVEALRLDPEYKPDLFNDEELENLKNAIPAEELYKMAGV